MIIDVYVFGFTHRHNVIKSHIMLQCDIDVIRNKYSNNIAPNTQKTHTISLINSTISA